MSTIYAPASDLFVRVLRRVDIQPDGCWLFPGCLNSRGYGCVSAGNGKTVLAHRLAVLADGRDLPDGMTVDHTCHDSAACRLGVKCPHRRCVNPEHLAVVTYQENNARQWEAGRCRKGHPFSTKPSGVRYCQECSRDYLRQRREQAGRVSA